MCSYLVVSWRLNNPVENINQLQNEGAVAHHEVMQNHSKGGEGEREFMWTSKRENGRVWTDVFDNEA